MNKLIVITGPSATGKTTIGNFLFENNTEIEKVWTCTTRPKRSDVDEYHFLSIEEFREKIAADEFVEWEEVYNGTYYGLLKSDIEKIWKKKITPVIIVDVKGAFNLKNIFKEKCAVFFISTTKDELIERLSKRGLDSNVDARINKMNFELSFQDSFDYLIENTDIFETYVAINKIIKSFLVQEKKSKTSVVNLFCGPSGGKSTMTAALFAELKYLGINCEIAPEYAKDKVWEKSFNVLNNQIYLFGKQHHRVFRLLDEVDVIITDSPLLMQCTYTYDIWLKNLIVSEVSKMNNINIVLKRKWEYQEKGRIHNSAQAKEKDREIMDLLYVHGTTYREFDSDRLELPNIVEYVLSNRN